MKQAPAWNKAVREFHGDPDILFADINFETDRVETIRGKPQDPGAPSSSRWPTIRHFNKKTGYRGRGYVQKTDMELRDELGPETDYLRLHILEKSALVKKSRTQEL